MGELMHELIIHTNTYNWDGAQVFVGSNGSIDMQYELIVILTRGRSFILTFEVKNALDLQLTGSAYTR